MENTGSGFPPPPVTVAVLLTDLLLLVAVIEYEPEAL